MDIIVDTHDRPVLSSGLTLAVSIGDHNIFSSDVVVDNRFELVPPVLHSLEVGRTIGCAGLVDLTDNVESVGAFFFLFVICRLINRLSAEQKSIK